MSPIVGIDLGTTNSLIGAMDAGFPVLIADADGERLTPSVVHFPASGEPLVGRAAAADAGGGSAANTVSSVKRFIGRRVGEERTTSAMRSRRARGEPVQIRVRGPRVLRRRKSRRSFCKSCGPTPSARSAKKSRARSSPCPRISTTPNGSPPRPQANSRASPSSASSMNRPPPRWPTASTSWAIARGSPSSISAAAPSIFRSSS